MNIKTESNYNSTVEIIATIKMIHVFVIRINYFIRT